MRPTLISATFLLALAGSALAQDETAPDFSGTWIFSSSSNGEQDPHPYRLQINQDDATVAVNGRSYLLGGTTLTEQGSSRLVHRTEWVGNALLITTEHFTDDGRSWSDMETYSFDHRAGTLNVYQMHVMATREPVMASHIVHYVREPE